MGNDFDILNALFGAALTAALPDGKFEGRLPLKPKGRTIVLGAGKASARMAAAFEEAWARVGGTCEGLVVTRYGHAAPTRFIEIVEAAHPVPDLQRKLVRTISSFVSSRVGRPPFCLSRPRA
jgi:glycerate 2-kinase